MKKIILLLVMSIVLVSMVSAADFLFKQNDIIDLKLPCSFNGNFCSSSAPCNISIQYPNSSIFVSNQNMTNIGNGFPNITLSSSSVLGEYTAFHSCSEGGFNDTAFLTFLITPSGREFTTAEGIIYFIFLIAAVLVFLLFCFMAFKVPWGNSRDEEGRVIQINDLRFFKIFFIVLSYVLLMWIFGILRSITANFLILNGGERFFNYLFWIMLYALWPLIVVSLFVTVISWLEGVKMKKILRRNLI